MHINTVEWVKRGNRCDIGQIGGIHDIRIDRKNAFPLACRTQILHIFLEEKLLTGVYRGNHIVIEIRRFKTNIHQRGIFPLSCTSQWIGCQKQAIFKRFQEKSAAVLARLS